MGKADAEMPEWVLQARGFIATGKHEFLTQAANACPDASVRQFLLCRELAEGLQVPEDAYEPLAKSLEASGRRVEATAVRLLGLHTVAKAADSPERHTREDSEFTAQVCNHAASLSQKAGFAECEAAFARTLGTRALELHQWQDAAGLLDHSLQLYRDLASREPAIYRPYVAGTLNNLGNVLSHMRQFPQARAAYEEGLPIYRDLASREPAIYRPDVAMTLNNLGNVLQEMRQFPQARAAYDEGLPIYRNLASREPAIYRPNLAATLNNLGNVLQGMRQFPQARAAYEEGLPIYRDLAGREPAIYRPYMAGTLNNLGNVLEELNEVEKAIEASRQAVEAAESAGGAAAHHHLAKGRASAAYRRVLADLSSRGDLDAVFRCLAAMREGPVLAFGRAAEHGLPGAGDQLSRVGRHVGQPVKILIVETLPREGLLLAILDARPPHLDVVRADAFAKTGETLFSKIQAGFGREGDKDPSARNALIRQLAKDAWMSLPERIRDVLESDDHQVLISGNAYWTMFPWEALCLGDGEQDFLGLRRPLARWGPLTAGALAGLRRAHFGGGERTASVIAPWDTVPHHLLLGTAIEAARASQSLSGLGYELRPGGRPWLGTAATAEVMNAVLRDPPAVIHFTGHGGIVGNEEVVLLWDPLREYEVFRYGRAQFEQLKAATGDPVGKLLPNGPLVVLNSCVTGRTRAHGGQREDLASALLAEGAAAVVASPLPIYDRVGLALGTRLYAQDGDGIGQTVLGIRRRLAATVCAQRPRLWSAWMLIACHGNPYARLPHQALNREGSGRPGS